jgi:hypothetical protein
MAKILQKSLEKWFSPHKIYCKRLGDVLSSLYVFLSDSSLRAEKPDYFFDGTIVFCPKIPTPAHFRGYETGRRTGGGASLVPVQNQPVASGERGMIIHLRQY